jgi:prepilin-type N-terminal cleavage/methylation domain-containing protein
MTSSAGNKMKTDVLKQSGFTLIELLVVISIIAVLAGITLGVTGNVQKKAASSRAQVEIAAIENALENYKIDNGDYPSTNSITISAGLYASNPTAATYLGTSPTLSAGTLTGGSGGRLLFTSLMGRTNLQAASGSDVAVVAGYTQYLELKPSQVGSPTASSYIMDPFGYAYGYFYDAAGNVNGVANSKSLNNFVVPDIWSTAGETGAISATAGSANNARYLRWITNWGSRQ